MQKHEDNLATQVDGAGLVPMPGVTVTVIDQSTGVAAALYSDNGVTPITTPIVTDNTGYYGFFAADGRYTITFTNPRIVTFTRDVILEDPKDNPYATLAQLAAPTGSTNIGNGTETVADSLNALQLADYAALRAYVGPRKSVYVIAPGIAGPFVRDDADTAVLATPVNAAFSVAAGSLAAATYYYRVSAIDGYGETLASAETSIAVPAVLAPPVNAAFSTATTGGTLAAATYYYRVTAINAVGETLASAETSIATTGTTSTVTVNWGAVSGATGYKVYGRTTGAELLMATLGAVTTWTDTGAVVPAGALPASNTTSGGVTVNWGAVANATGYKIYGRTTGAELLMATVGAVTTWTDNGSVAPAGALPAGYKKDNGGTVIEASNGKRWKRPFQGAANVAWFGAKADWNDNTLTGTDDTTAVQAALTAHAKVYFPAACRVTADLNVTQPYPVLMGDGKYTGAGIVRTGAGAGTALIFSAATLYPRMQGLRVKRVPTVSTDYFNTGSIGIDTTAANTSIDLDDVWVQGHEKLINGNYNGFYNKADNCRFENFKYGFYRFSVNNLNVTRSKFVGFNEAFTVNGTGGPANIIGNSFEIFNGYLVNSTGVEHALVNFHWNYVETYDTTSLPTNFPQAANAQAGKFGGNVLFAGPYSTLSIRNNDLWLGGVYIVSSLSACDRYESLDNTLHLYTAGENMLYMVNLPTVQSCVIKDVLGAPVGASGSYTTTYNQSANIPAISSPYGEFSFYDSVQGKPLLCPTKKAVPTLLNGWTSGPAADGAPTIIFGDSGFALQGTVTGTSSTGAGVVIFTLPSAQRPPVNGTARSFCFLSTNADEGSGVTVQLRYLYSTGDFRLENTPASKANIVLDGLFVPAQL